MGPFVVGTDGSPGANLAVQRAAELAKGIGARVHLVTAVPDVALREPIVSSARTDPVDLGGVAESVLVRAARVFHDAGVEVETHTRGGDPAHAMIEVADEEQADLIIVGARGATGLQRILLGSVSSKLSHYASTSVMVVRELI